MTASQRKEIKTKIVQELEALKIEIAELTVLCKPIAPECALGDLARFELMNDQLITEKTLKETQIRRNKLEYALRKVDKDSYGLCVACDEEILYERLLILPESTHCIECASNLH